MTTFLIALALFAALVGIVAQRLRWIKSGGELGKTRRAEAEKYAPPPRGYDSWEMYWGYKESEGPR